MHVSEIFDNVDLYIMFKVPRRLNTYSYGTDNWGKVCQVVW